MPPSFPAPHLHFPPQLFACWILDGSATRNKATSDKGQVMLGRKARGRAWVSLCREEPGVKSEERKGTERKEE